MAIQAQSTPTPAVSIESSIDICLAIFGEHPEDVISPIKSAADALIWLEEIFNTIKHDAQKGGNNYRIKQLAEAGAYLAADVGNYAHCAHESMVSHLVATEVIPPKGDSA